MGNLIPIFADSPVQPRAPPRGPPSIGPPGADGSKQFTAALAAAAARATTGGPTPTAPPIPAASGEQAGVSSEWLAALALLVLGGQPVLAAPDPTAATSTAGSAGFGASVGGPAPAEALLADLADGMGGQIPLLQALASGGSLALPGGLAASVPDGASAALAGGSSIPGGLDQANLAQTALAWLQRLGMSSRSVVSMGSPGESGASPGNPGVLPVGAPAVGLELSAAGRILAGTPQADTSTPGVAGSQAALAAGDRVSPVQMGAAMAAPATIRNGSQPGAVGATSLSDAAERLLSGVAQAASQSSQSGNGGTAGQRPQSQPGTPAPLGTEGRLGALTPLQGAPAGESVSQSEAVTFSVEPFDVRLAQVLARQARLTTRDGSQELTLRLNPPRLGTLNVQLTHRDGQVAISLVAASAEAQRLLQRSLPLLRAALVEQGIQVSRMEVTVREPAQGSNSSLTGGFEQGQGQNGNANGSGSRASQQSFPGGTEQAFDFGAFLGLDETPTAPSNPPDVQASGIPAGGQADPIGESVNEGV